jgi:hypothetical protein
MLVKPPNSLTFSRKPRSVFPLFVLVVGLTLGKRLFPQDLPRHSQSRSDDSGAVATQPAQPGKIHGTAGADYPVRSLIKDSEALPPEFASDLVLQLLEKGFVQAQPLRLKLLKQAFEKASAAQDDVGRRPWGAAEQSPDGFHAIASNYTGLDRISLQTRVVRLALSIDPALGRHFFESIRPPQITPAVCNQKWRFAPDSYYETLSEVLKVSFSNREITNGLRASYVDSVLQNNKSHVQVLAITRMLNAANLTEQDLRETVPVYAASLREFDEDTQSFGILMAGYGEFFDATYELVSLLEKNRIESTYLIQALRDYLVLNLKHSNCTAADVWRDPKSGLPASISRFNERFQKNLARANLRPIGENEIKRNENAEPEKPLPNLQWNSQVYSQLLLAVQDLNAPVGDSSAQDQIAWSSRVRDLLAQLDDWSEPNEPEAVLFRQKAMLLAGVCKRTNGTPVHAEALTRFRSYLEQNSYEEVNWIDWFVFVKQLLATSIRKGKPRGDLDAFVDSRDPVLSTYARLELLLLQPGTPPLDGLKTQPTSK